MQTDWLTWRVTRRERAPVTPWWANEASLSTEKKPRLNHSVAVGDLISFISLYLSVRKSSIVGWCWMKTTLDSGSCRCVFPSIFGKIPPYLPEISEPSDLARGGLCACTKRGWERRIQASSSSPVIYDILQQRYTVLFHPLCYIRFKSNMTIHRCFWELHTPSSQTPHPPSAIWKGKHVLINV